VPRSAGAQLAAARRVPARPPAELPGAEVSLAAFRAGEDQFVTGLLLRIDLHSGRMLAVNAGHPSPYRLRDGRVEC